METIKIFSIIFLLLFVGNNSQSQTINSDWVKSFGNTGWDIPNDIVVDSSENIFVTGSYYVPFKNRNLVFSKSIGELNSFVAKYDSNGNMIWRKGIPESEKGYGCLLIRDKKNRLYIAGGAALKDANRTTQRSLFSYFLSCMDENGNIFWTKKILGNKLNYITSIAIDSITEDICIGGYFQDSLIIENKKYLSNGKADAFFLRYNSDGMLLHSGTFGGNGDDKIDVISFDSIGNVIFSGTFQKILKFRNGQCLRLENPKETGVFLVKFSALSDYLSAGILCHGKNIKVSGISLKQDQLFLSGSFSDMAIFENAILRSQGNDDAFLTCYNKSLNIKWIKRIGGSNKERACEIFCERDNVILIGSFSSDFLIDGILVSPTNESPDVFIISFNNKGNVNWVRCFGGELDDYPKCITSDLKQNIYVAGSYRGEMVLDNNAISSNGEEDIFIAKLNNCNKFFPGFKESFKFCQGTKLTLDAGDGFVSYNWNNGLSLVRTVDVFDPGNYSLELTTLNGCRMFDTAHVAVIQQPDVFIGNDTIITDTSFIVLKTNKSFSKYTWNNGLNTSDIIVKGSEYPMGLNKFWVQVTNADSCLGYDELYLTILKTDKENFDKNIPESCIIFPNPTDGKISIYIQNSLQTLAIKVINSVGIVITSRSFKNYLNGTIIKL